MINFKFFACEPRVYYPLRNPYYIDLHIARLVWLIFTRTFDFWGNRQIIIGIEGLEIVKARDESIGRS